MKIGQTIGILIILLILLLGVTYVLSDNKDVKFQAPLASVGSIKEPKDVDTTVISTEIIHIVSYSSNGFSPSNLILSKGESVRFENNTEELMWVMSEESKGCSEGIDEFDQCYPSKEFEYKFNEAGEWGFYNHLNKEHSGVVVVL